MNNCFFIWAFIFFRIAELKEIDLAKSRKETSLNNLETAIIETREKLEQSDYSSSATEIETRSILDKCSEVIFSTILLKTFEIINTQHCNT